VERLELQRLGFARAQAALTGRPGYAPRDRLKLCIDGDLNRIRSSRRLERETHRHVELIGLLRKLRPDVKTIADFRNQNAKALPALVRELVLLGQQLDRFGAARLALDGSTCKAVNNTHQHFTQTTLEKALKETLGVERRRAVADLGSSHGHAITACDEAGIEASGPNPSTSANPKRGLWGKERFSEDPQQDCYRCPGGAELPWRCETTELGRHLRSSATAACKRGPRKEPCTRNQDGRRITHGGAEHSRERREERRKAAPEIMPERKPRVEHPCGTIKPAKAQGYFLMKGLQHVRAEVSLSCLADHLTRVLNILGVPRLLVALG
jgi:transposase